MCQNQVGLGSEIKVAKYARFRKSRSLRPSWLLRCRLGETGVSEIRGSEECKNVGALWSAKKARAAPFGTLSEFSSPRSEHVPTSSDHTLRQRVVDSASITRRRWDDSTRTCLNEGHFVLVVSARDRGTGLYGRLAPSYQFCC